MFKKHMTYLLTLLFCALSNASEVNIDMLLEQAKSQNKHVMFYHHIPGCPYCKKMLEENFKDPNILKIINENFVYVEIYTAHSGPVIFKNFTGTHKEFSVYAGAVAYPATIFMNSEGEIVHRAIGYRNIDEHLADITYISTKNYETINLESYIEKLEFEKE